MIEATIESLREHGVAGMSFTEVLAASGAARGAIYHHFPGGKAQLIAEAAARNAADVHDRLAELPTDDPRTVVEAFLTTVRPVVQASADGSGCAVAAVTVAVGTDADNDTLCGIAATAFDSWSTRLADQLTTAGLPRDAATDLATTLIILLEGAHVLCRAARSIEPFDRAARSALLLAEAR